MIRFSKTKKPKVNDIIKVFNSSLIVRPTNNPNLIKEMFENANIIISAWDKDELVGICRALTDFSYCCYLSDIAVHKDYQFQGIGRKMITKLKKSLNENVSIILLSSPKAMEYYPKVGFEKIQNGFIIKRKK